ncbi:hypothetical protein ACE6H2_012812 [Prunus campanulata]
MAEYLFMRSYSDLKAKFDTAEVQHNHARASLNRFGDILENTRPNSKRFVNIKNRLELEALVHFYRERILWHGGRINISQKPEEVIPTADDLIFMAYSNGIFNFTTKKTKARSDDRFKQYVRKFSAARSAKRGYDISLDSLFQFVQQMENIPVVVETLEETKTLVSLCEKFNNSSVSVIIPSLAGEEVTFALATMAMTKGLKHLHIQGRIRYGKVAIHKRSLLE